MTVYLSKILKIRRNLFNEKNISCVLYIPVFINKLHL